MKKIFGIIALIALFATSLNAQTVVRLKQAAAADTIHKSQTLYTQSVNINAAALQAVSIQVKTTTVSGSPDVSYVLQRSIDGVNWISVVGDTVTSVTSVSKLLNINPFYGNYARVAYYTGSGTQLSKVAITLKSANLQK